MANLIGGIIGLTIGVVMFTSVFMTTIKGANTTAWSTSEIAIYGVLGIVGLAGLAYGVGAVFGII